MGPLRRLAVGFGVVVGALALTATPAGAHALRVASDPDAGANLAKAPTQVTVTFGEQPDPALSSLRVLDSTGQDHAAGKATVAPGQPVALTVAVKPLTKGVYTVSWRTVSKIDGHLASGTFAFGVQESPGAAAAAKTSGVVAGPSSSSVASRWAMYAGLMLIVGASVTAVVCFAEPPRHLLAILSVGVVLALAGVIRLGLVSAHASGLSTSKLLGSSLGHELLRRAVPILAAGVLLLATALLWQRAGRRWRVLAALVGAAGAGAMFGDITSSHAAAAHSWRLARMAIQWAHFAGAGVWVGGLFILVVHLRGLAPDARARTARRFSAMALGAVLVIAGAGAQRAFDEVGSWHRLATTAFGHQIVIKSSLFAVLIALGAINRFRSVPRAAERPRLLGRISRGEIVVAAGVLVATGVLQGLAPPTSVAGPQAANPIVVSAADFATTVRLRVTITPGMAGFNHFTLQAKDYDTAAPVAANPVTLTFGLPARPDLGSSTLTLKRAGPGAYEADAANLSIDGTWNVTALLQRPSGGVEVRFNVTPRRPPQRITVLRFRGAPDVYTLELPANQSVQTYLDPGRIGQLNEFHVTFLGATGIEVPMASSSVTAKGPGSAAAAQLTVRRLDPIGHFVADLPSPVKGRYSFEVEGTSAAGQTIQGTFTIPVR